MVTRQLPLLAPRPRGCALNAGELKAQRERLATLPSAVSAVERRGQPLSVTFDAGVDEKMIDAIVATERECCPFVQISNDRLLRRLVIATTTPEEASALDVLGAALTGADKARE